MRASLVVQGLKIHLPTQRTQAGWGENLPWSGKIALAVGQLSPWATTTESVL